MLAWATLTACAALLWNPFPAAAQDKPASDKNTAEKPAPAAPEKDKKSVDATDVAPLFTALDDLGELRVLNPLKLTPDELEKMAALIAEAQTDYNKRLLANAAPAIRKVASNILAAKKKALTGETLASDDAILTAMTDYETQRKVTEAATLKSLSEKLQTLLTETQVKAASKIAKDEQTKVSGSAGKGTDAQFFNLYVLRVIMGYPRLVPLLKEMQAARTK